MKKKTIAIFTLFIGCLYLLYGADIKVIEEPVPLFSGTADAKTLVLEKSIENISDKELQVFAGIMSITVDKSGNYYMFDYRHVTIIKLNGEFEFVRKIGREGEGPGEFKVRGGTSNHVSIGLDGKLYLVNWLGRRIKKYSLQGKYIGEFKFEQFKGFRVSVDKKGNLYLPSIKEHIIDIHDSEMKYKKSLIPIRELKTFLFFKPPACVIYRYTIPDYSNSRYDWLSTGELVLLNQFDLSISILNPETGKIKKKFYAWEDYILSEFETKIKKVLKKVEKSGAICGYNIAFISFFIDSSDNIFLEFINSQNSPYLYKFSRNGELIQVYKIAPAEIDGLPRFFRFKDNRFYSYSDIGIHIFKEKVEN